MSAEDQAEPSTLLPVISHLCASGGQERRSAYFRTVRYALIGVYEILYSDNQTIKNVALITVELIKRCENLKCIIERNVRNMF